MRNLPFYVNIYIFKQTTVKYGENKARFNR